MNQNKSVMVYINAKLYIGVMDLIEHIEELQEKYLKNDLMNDTDSSYAFKALRDINLWIGEHIPEEIDG